MQQQPLRGRSLTITLAVCLLACQAPGNARIALVALDGASWRVLDPLMAQGHLPTLSMMVKRGARGNLKTLDDVRLISPAIWTTVATGKLPEHHGIVDYIQRSPDGRGKRRLVDSTMRTTGAVWTILSDHGVDVGIIGWWATWPAERVNGFVVTDRYPHTRWEEWHNARQHAHLVHPAMLEPTLMRLVRTPERFRPEELSFLLPLTPSITMRLNETACTRYDPFLELKYTYLEQESYLAAARHLLSRHKPAFFAIYLTLVDVAEHFFWQHLEPEHFQATASSPDLAGVIGNAYRHADSAIADLISLLGRDYDWIVVSDHSMLPTGRTPLSGSHYRDRVLHSPQGYASQELGLDGIILGWGPHIRKGTLEGAAIADITPTILYMMGVPVGRDMDGHPLEDLLTPSFLRSQRPGFVDSHDREAQRSRPPPAAPGEQRLKRKLKALGYVD